MKTGEVWNEKVYMSPRFPPKISLKHEWKRELGSEHAQRPEGQVVQQSISFQSNQPTLNPIRERSGRLDITHDVIGVQDERKTSRSQKVDVDSFCEPSSSERTGRPVTGPVLGKPFHETSVIQTRSSEERKEFIVEQADERTGRLVITHDVINVSDSSQTRSAHESETFNVGAEILRKKTERSVADHDVSHEQTMLNDVNMDFRIPGLPRSVVKHSQSTSVRDLIQKIENHPNRHALQQDLRQTKPTNHLVQNQRKWFRMWQHRIVCIARNGTQNAVHSMPITLEQRHRLWHMRAYIAESNSGQSKIR